MIIPNVYKIFDSLLRPWRHYYLAYGINRLALDSGNVMPPGTNSTNSIPTVKTLQISNSWIIASHTDRPGRFKPEVKNGENKKRKNRWKKQLQLLVHVHWN